MRVVIPNDFRAEAWLSSSELEDYGISYEEIDYKNIETRRFLWRVAGDMASISGVRVPMSGKLLIEVIKDGSDLYKICFSSLGSSLCDNKSVKQLVKSEKHSIIAEFSDFEHILRCLPRLEKVGSSALFEKAGKYRMIFGTLSSDFEDVADSVCEFAQIIPLSDVQLARCREDWSCIIAENAVKKLSEYF